MTAALTPGARQARDRREVRSFAAVVVLVGVALAAGMLVRLSVERAVQPVDQAGLNADLPAGWIVLPPAGDRLLTAYDPLDPDLRYGVAAVDPAAGTTLTPEDAAARRIRDRGQLLQAFAISAQGPGTLGTAPTYEVRYSFVDRAPGGQATPIEVIEHYVVDGAIFPEDRVLVLILEAPPGKLTAALPDFERFARELADRAGSAAALPPDVAVRYGGPRLATIAGTPAGAPGALAATEDLVNATVQILMVATIGGQEQAYGWGSGTILSADGLILTNAHVAMPTAAGLGVYEADPTPPVDPEDLIVAIIASEDQPAVPRYRATVVSADGYLDAAVIKIDRDLDGRPLAGGGLSLPTVPIGDSEAVRVGDPLTVVGYPGIGGDTISLSAGRASGFLGDDRIGPRAWIKTDAVISSGNSGGLAANAAGELIGIPTRAPDDEGGYSWIRPIALVAPLIADARADRRTVDSPYLVPATGRETVRLDSWTDSNAECPARNRLTTYPSGTGNIVAAFEHSGLATGEDVISQWRLDGEIILRGGFRLEPGAESGGCLFLYIYSDRGLPDGNYLIEVFAGPTLRAMTTAQTAIGSVGASGSGTLTGLVVDADSGRPVPGAVVFLLAPGTDLEAWFDSPQESQIASFAKTGADGTFLVAGLTAGSSYPALAMAEGYVAAGGTVGPMQPGDNALNNPIALTRVAP
ncbi:MAG: trypsin-like peptidase domain-containing protein [Chloroflexota bacterium]